MKKIIVLLYAVILMSSCGDSKKNMDTCQISDTRVIGTWKLVKKCLCYNYGGDWIWRNFTDTLTFSLNNQCIAIQSGNTDSSCNKGKYSIKNDTIKVVFNCSGGGTSTNVWLYSFDSKNDTLLLKGFVDEGYFGFKYIKTDKMN